MMRASRPGFVSLKKTVYGGQINASVSATSGAGNFAFTLAQNTELVSHAALYDQYRICAILMRMVPKSSDALVGGTGSLGVVYTYIDSNDAGTPGSAQEVLNRQSFKQHRADKPWTEFIKHPRTASPVYNGTVVSGYETNKGNQWMSTANTGIPHYGWKYYADNIANQQIDVWISLYVQFKDPK